MAAQIPVKAIYSGSDVTSLGEFASSDDITITYLPTGTSSSTVALGDHTHSYLPLAGGTLTGNLITTALIDGRDVAADGVLATNALPKAGGAMTGAITTNSTFDGVDIAVRDAILTSTTTTAGAALPKAGGTMTGTIASFTSTGIDDNATETAITIDATENIGIGVVPEDWHSAYDGGIVQINSHGAIFSQGAETYLTNNVYEPQSGGMKHINTNVATLYSQQTGQHFFKTAASASADAVISWTTALNLKANATAEFGASVIAKTDTDTSNTGSITLDFATNQNFVLTLTGNVTLANPTTEQVGQSGFIAFIQDGTGSRTVALGTDYETAAAAGLTLTATASATDLVPYLVVASGRILLGTPQLAFA